MVLTCFNIESTTQPVNNLNEDCWKQIRHRIVILVDTPFVRDYKCLENNFKCLKRHNIDQQIGIHSFQNSVDSKELGALLEL